MQKMKNQKGITLIALIITIIVMLILVGVSVTVALNGGLFETAKKAAQGTQISRDKELELSSMGTWLQNGTTVKELIAGKTIQVGTTVTGNGLPTVDGMTWKVLGVENGKLLLTTSEPIGNVSNGYSIEGSTDKWDAENNKWKFEDELNNLFSNPENANYYINTSETKVEKIRSINVDDINRVTEYNPTKDDSYKETYGTSRSYDLDWKEEWTFDYSAQEGPLISADFYHPDGRVLGENGVDNITVFFDGYGYTPNYDGNSQADKLLFGISPDDFEYWLASSFVAVRDSGYGDSIDFGLHYVRYYGVTSDGSMIWNSRDRGKSLRYGVRPVIVMSSDFLPETES